MTKQAVLAKATTNVSTNAAAQTAMQKIQAEGQMKMQYRQADIAFEIEKMKS